jgi:hypothetical protein
MLNPDTEVEEEMSFSCFRKIAKGIISFVMSVRPFAWGNLAHTGWIFVKSDI